MAWAAPRTFVAGEVLSASIFNTDHRDNLIFLNTGRGVQSQTLTWVDVANKTTTSATFVDSDSTNHKVTIIPQSTRVKVEFGFFASATTTDGEFDIKSTALGTRAGDATHGLGWVVAGNNTWMRIIGYFSGLTPNASNDFTLQFRNLTGGNTTTIFNNARPIERFASEY